MKGIHWQIKRRLDAAMELWRRGERGRARPILDEVIGLLSRQGRMSGSPAERTRCEKLVRELRELIAEDRAEPRAEELDAGVRAIEEAAARRMELKDLVELAEGHGNSEAVGAEPMPQPIPDPASPPASVDLATVLLDALPHERTVTAEALTDLRAGEHFPDPEILEWFAVALREAGTDRLSLSHFRPRPKAAPPAPPPEPGSGAAGLRPPEEPPEDPPDDPATELLRERLRVLAVLNDLPADAVGALLKTVRVHGTDPEEAVADARKVRDEERLSRALAELGSLLSPGEREEFLRRLAAGEASVHELLERARSLFTERRESRLRERREEWLNHAAEFLSPDEVQAFRDRFEGEEPAEEVLSDLRGRIDAVALEKVLVQILDTDPGPLGELDPQSSRQLKAKLMRRIPRLHPELARDLDRDRVRSAVVEAAEELIGIREQVAVEKDPEHQVEDMVLERSSDDFDDVAGMEGLKKRLLGTVTRALSGMVPADRCPVGCILYGAPGTGKSFLARATAGEVQRSLGMTVIHVPIEGVQGLHWSKQVSRISEIFRLARRHQPSLVIWDEFDTYVADPRVTNRKYDEKICTLFKQKLEGIQKTSEVVYHLATCNYPWRIELPILARHRLGDTILVGLPDAGAREAMLRYGILERCDPDAFDIPALVAATDGMTSAEITALVSQAVFHLPYDDLSDAEDQLRLPTQGDFETALLEQQALGYESYIEVAGLELSRPKFKPMRHHFAELVKLCEVDGAVR